jgi:DNA repair protein RadA/Sms
VLEKRAGLNLAGEDVFANVAGGVSVEEPAADVAVVAALVSGVRNRPLATGTVLFGEVGLAGELRRATHAALRIREAARMGFTRAVVPCGTLPPEAVPVDVTLVEAATIGELIDVLF